MTSTRMDLIRPSPASQLRRRVRELHDRGVDVIDLSSGDIGLPTPDHVIDAAVAAARQGDTRYTNVDGAPETKDAVRAQLERQNGLVYDRSEVIVSSGSTQAIAGALMATLEDGDEVIVPVPCWAPYIDQVRLNGGRPVELSCRQNNSLKLRPDELAAAITPRTRWLILNNPVNPTGAVYTLEELAVIARVLLAHPSVWLLCDNLYENIVFDGVTAPCLLEVEPRLKERTLVVSGVAKSYAMMGWRIGYAAGPSALIAEMAKIQSVTTSCASSVSQAAAVAALTGPQDLLAERASALARQRNMLAEDIRECAGLACTPPAGTFYLLASCAGVLGKCDPQGIPVTDDTSFAHYLLQSCGVAVMPGSVCGITPRIRMNFALPPATLRNAGQRLRAACAALK
jgi:aspartate aminotransferase